MDFLHCNEKGMRFESATVPAAVKPGHDIRDDGFKKYLPLSVNLGMGRLLKTGISQKTCQKKRLKLSGRKAKNLLSIPAFPYPVCIICKTGEESLIFYSAAVSCPPEWSESDSE